MNIKCDGKTTAQRVKAVLTRAGLQYSEHGPYIGSSHIDILVQSDPDEETLRELKSISGVTIAQG